MEFLPLLVGKNYLVKTFLYPKKTAEFLQDKFDDETGAKCSINEPLQLVSSVFEKRNIYQVSLSQQEMIHETRHVKLRENRLICT